MASAGLDTTLHVMATSVDKFDLRYVAAFEYRTMPIYGVQFHPEKPPFEWNTKEISIPHTAASIEASMYFADFFVNEGRYLSHVLSRVTKQVNVAARQSGHKFPNTSEEWSHLIFNYSPTFTGAENLTYDQCYFFD